MKESHINNGFDEHSAKEKAFSNIMPNLQEELENIYLLMRQLKKDSIHKKILHTKDAFVEIDDFDPEKAIKAAIDKRKFLMKRLLNDHEFANKEENKESNDH